MFKLTVNPLLRPPGEGLIFSNPILGGGGGGVNRDGELI